MQRLWKVPRSCLEGHFVQFTPQHKLSVACAFVHVRSIQFQCTLYCDAGEKRVPHTKPAGSSREGAREEGRRGKEGRRRKIWRSCFFDPSHPHIRNSCFSVLSFSLLSSSSSLHTLLVPLHTHSLFLPHIHTLAHTTAIMFAARIQRRAFSASARNVSIFPLSFSFPLSLPFSCPLLPRLARRLRLRFAGCCSAALLPLC